MTTIAFDGRYLAVDSQITYESTRFTGKKWWIVTTPDGTQAFVTGCGTTASIQAARSALEAGEKLPKGDYWLVVAHFGGGIFEFNGKSMLNTCDFDIYATGSGLQAALGAMKAGATAGRAVEIAAEVDTSTGLPVHVFDTQVNRMVTARKRR